MNAKLRWRLRSYVPGTPERIYYDAVTDHVRAVMSLTVTLFPASPPFPMPIPRNEEACVLALDSMLALLRALKAAVDGGDARAVFGEHSPSASRT